MQWFNFCFPIGWNELSAIATSIAVIAALWGNRKTTVQMRNSLRAQEQSKNLMLFEKRVKIIQSVEADQEVSDLEIQLLFSDYIVSIYKNLKKLKSEKDSYCSDLKTYKFLIEDVYDELGIVSPLPEIEKVKWIMEELEYPQDKVEEYDKLCREHEISSTFGSESEEWRTYNYKTISDNIDNTQNSINRCRDNLVSEMSKFVQLSIASLLKEGV